MKKQVLTVVLCFCAVVSYAQVVPRLVELSTNNQQLIEEALKNSFVIIHSQYQMQDITIKEPTFYGSNGNEYFGETYSVAVKTQGGYLLENSALFPWLYDSKYAEYIDSKQFRPVPLMMEYRQFADSVYTKYDKAIEFKDVKPILNQKLLFLGSNEFDGKGMFAKTLEAKNEGWIVWLAAEKPLENEPNYPKFSFVTYRYEQLVNKKPEPVYDIETPKANNKILLGGIYVLPEITGIGEISFRLLGTLSFESEEDLWQIIPVVNSNSQKFVKAVKVENKKPNQSVTLTPVQSKGNNNQKNKPKK
ncbi:MAG: hypothetical protein LBN95_11470 [Prevotellaceae bacterium]|jgi:hypothetical protein|nr:hypothetical protein [Prevotellaceae bacterium]